MSCAGSTNRLANEIASLKRQLADGSAELRRYVEGNGFQWQENESAVFNATSAIGLMGGEIEILKRRIAERDKRLAWCEQLKAESLDAVKWLGERDFPQITKALKAVLAAEPQEPTDANR